MHKDAKHSEMALEVQEKKKGNPGQGEDRGRGVLNLGQAHTLLTGC